MFFRGRVIVLSADLVGLNDEWIEVVLYSLGANSNDNMCCWSYAASLVTFMLFKI